MLFISGAAKGDYTNTYNSLAYARSGYRQMIGVAFIAKYSQRMYEEIYQKHYEHFVPSIATIEQFMITHNISHPAEKFRLLNCFMDYAASSFQIEQMSNYRMMTVVERQLDIYEAFRAYILPNRGN